MNSERQSETERWSVFYLQSRMARAALGLSVRGLAEAAGVSHDTIVRVEAGAAVKASTFENIRGTFEAAGIVFIDQDDQGPGIRLANRISTDRFEAMSHIEKILGPPTFVRKLRPNE